jgi:penicillin-binding protein 2
LNIGWRLGVLAVAFATLFAILTLRLWSIQVTAAADYEEAAQNNLVKFVDTPAPRGQIRDINGVVLADNRNARVAVIEGALVSREGKDQLVRNLAAFSGRTAAEIEELVEEARRRGDRIVVVPELTDEQVIFLAEHPEDFLGVRIVETPIRVYVNGDLAPDVLGYIGRPDVDDLEKPGIKPTDVLGKAGVEREYDGVIRGTSGRIKYRINARGEILDQLGEQLPSPGGTVILTIDSPIQEILNSSLDQGLSLARELHQPGGCVPRDADPGCPVRATGIVLDVTDGSVLAMSSIPAFDPNIFVEGVSDDEWARLNSQAVFNNFAIQGLYAPASTFKTVAYLAALEEGIFPQDVDAHDGTYDCDGLLEFRFNDGSPQVYNDWLAEGHGPVDLHGGLQASCDLYFWEIALKVWNGRNSDYDQDLLQQWARKFGFDKTTGIDLPFERRGLIPDEDWFTTAQEETPLLVRDTPWAGGDVMNIVIGQGSVLATPLQLANAYAAMVNGGTVWQPRVVDRVETADGTVLDNPPFAVSTVELGARTDQLLRFDLQQVVNGSRGTARTAFANFGENVELVGGKTGTGEVIKGTAENPEDVDNALFVGVAPINDPKYVVVVIIERGGSGGRIAAPTAARVLQFLLNGADGVTDVGAGEEAD